MDQEEEKKRKKEAEVFLTCGVEFRSQSMPGSPILIALEREAGLSAPVQDWGHNPNQLRPAKLSGGQ